HTRFSRDWSSDVCSSDLRTVPDWNVEISLPGYRPNYTGNRRQIREAARLLTAAQKPLIMVGSGVIWGEATGELRALAERTGVPRSEERRVGKGWRARGGR